MENKINLFEDSPDKTEKHDHKEHADHKSKRPARLDLSALQPHRQKWAECKIYGKNILIRSYAGACGKGDQVFVYGGLQILNGVLSDFHSIDTKPKDNTLEWKSVAVKNPKNTPGPRAKHGLVIHKSKIYLVGGIKSAVEISNQIYVYDTDTQFWQRLVPNGAQLPPLETFGCVLVDNEHPKIITLCGYDGKLCEPTNAVYSYDILSNTMEVLYQHNSTKGKQPMPRLGCGVAFDQKDKIYMFGGKAQQRLNDLWVFDINTKLYTQIQQDEISRPVVRNGHSMTYFEGLIFVFGGIHDITWELDDLHIYNIRSGQWMVLETDSARKKQTNIPIQKKQSISLDKKDRDTELEKKKATTFTVANNAFNFKKPITSEEVPEVSSPTKTTNQLKYKAFLHRKAQMLRNFEVKEDQKSKLIIVEPSSQAMKNSLDMIGVGLAPPESPTKIRRNQFSKTTYSKFMQPLVVTTCFTPGKKPCARDGHNAIIIGKQLLFFGGDRHHMSFNDMYILQLDAVINELPKH